MDKADTFPKDPAVEGRLIALRQMLALIAAGRDPDAILEEAEGVAQDAQEDPGAVPSEGFAIQQATAEERRLFARELRSLLGDRSGR